jgi:hypothetical protein
MVKPDATPVGPKVLTNTLGEKECCLDIIFVHGLRGHRENTWTDTAANVFWPRDLLPEIMGTARVISWGYDANVANFLSAASQASVFGHAQTLLADLADQRLDVPVC